MRKNPAKEYVKRAAFVPIGEGWLCADINRALQRAFNAGRKFERNKTK